jgi:hypothetical protein
MKGVEQFRKQRMLADGEGRGTGRLILILKPMPARVTADWMVQQWRSRRRTKVKIGSYPAMSLTDAREIFRRDFADVIQRGRSIKVAGDNRLGTVSDLLDGYINSLKAAGKPSWPDVQANLDKVADILGRNRPARSIIADDVLGVLRPIYKRGASAMADHTRSYIRSAFSWGLKAEHDYRSNSRRRFKLTVNPAAGIPTEPKAVGSRWLDEDEFVRLYRWLEAVSATTLYSFMWRQRERGVIPFVTNRDLRRTWKTLAGKAGVSKEIRDRIQNHALQDVGSKNYDRWTYVPEKRAAMDQWNAFITSLLHAHGPQSLMTRSAVVRQGCGRAFPSHGRGRRFNPSTAHR